MKHKLLKKKANLFKKNNKGMALVTVIVAIGFVAALVSVLMLTTLVNFKMKSTNERSKDTFYSAEQAIAEINVGLQHVISESMSEAYMDIMANYQTYDVTQKTELLTTKYYEAIWEKLEVSDKGNGFYDVKVLEDFLKPTTKWHEPTGASDGYGAIVVAVNKEGATEKEEKYGQMITYQKSGVVLKNLKVYYKDQMGFVSVVQTDIRLAYPEFDFANTSELPTIPKYAFVADNGATIEAKSNLALAGNIYTNNLVINNGDASSKLNVYTSTDQVITSKYNIEINKNINLNGTDVLRDAKGDIAGAWTPTTEMTAITLRARDLILDSAQATISGKLLLANDLNLKGKNSAITLTGEFTGYGMGSDVLDTSSNLQWSTTPPDSQWSSAILINGKNTKIDLSGLREITLYGHSFVGTDKSEYYNKRANATGANAVVYDDILEVVTGKNESRIGKQPVAMGESIAVKTNQMLYLVPPSAIGVDANGKSMFNKNPMTEAEYRALQAAVASTADPITEISATVPLSELGGDTLENYIDTSVADLSNNVEKIWTRVNDEGVGSLVYYYIKFKDETTANRFYSTRYEGSKDKFDKYASSYLQDIKWPNTSNMLTFNIAGYAVDRDGDDFTRIPASINTVTTSDEHKNKSVRYMKDFRGMCRNLETKQDEADYAAVTFAGSYEDEEKDPDVAKNNQQVFENIIKESNIDKFMTDVTSGVAAYDNIKMVTASGLVNVYDVSSLDSAAKEATPQNGTLVAIITNSDSTDITLNDSNKDVKLVITRGDVKVTRDFKGLILADGKIEFDGTNLRIEADPDEVRKILQFGYVDSGTGDVITIAYTLVDGTQYIYSASAAGGYSSDLALGGLISYENWKKD